MRPARFAALALLLALSGCSSLLPTGHEEVRSPWHSFDEAKAAIESIVVDRTTVAQLRELGIDPYTSPNVQLLSYSDVLLRFPLNGSFASNRLDTGLRDCLEAGKACFGYAINVRDVKRDRTGNFWQDAFGFKRVTEVTGWTFNALILLKDDRVVYTLYGGQPKLHEQDVARQPLGPVQNFGDAASGAIVR